LLERIRSGRCLLHRCGVLLRDIIHLGHGPVDLIVDMRRHIEAGKQCMRLAMTWDDRVSFVLTPSLTIKRVTPLDVIKEAADPTAQNDDEPFESDQG